MDLSLERVQARLRQHEASLFSLPGGQRAAVAILLRFSAGAAGDEAAGDGPLVLLMRRVHHEKDRWSGQVSLPGGREEPVDVDLVATAVRESHEEVGVELGSSARLVGALGSVPAVAKGRILPMTIHPFVFIETTPVAPVAGPEAARVFWLPLGAAARGDLDATFHYRAGPVSLPFACWQYDGETVWGLTHRILRELLSVVDEG